MLHGLQAQTGVNPPIDESLNFLWLGGLVKRHADESGGLMIPVAEVNRLKEDGVPLIPPKIIRVDEKEEDEPSVGSAPRRLGAGPAAGTVAGQRSAVVQRSYDEVELVQNHLRKRKLDLEVEQVEDSFRARQRQVTALAQAERKRREEEDARWRQANWENGWRR